MVLVWTFVGVVVLNRFQYSIEPLLALFSGYRLCHYADESLHCYICQVGAVMQESTLSSFVDVACFLQQRLCWLLYMYSTNQLLSVELQLRLVPSRRNNTIYIKCSQYLQTCLPPSSFFMFETDMCNFVKSCFTNLHFYHVYKHNIYTAKTSFGDIDWCQRISCVAVCDCRGSISFLHCPI